jgi:hypothetical protein
VLSSATAMGNYIMKVTLPATSVTSCPLRLWNFPEDEVYVVWRMYRPYKEADPVNKPSYQLSKNNIQKPGKREVVGIFFWLSRRTLRMYFWNIVAGSLSVSTQLCDSKYCRFGTCCI